MSKLRRTIDEMMDLPVEHRHFITGSKGLETDPVAERLVRGVNPAPDDENASKPANFDNRTGARYKNEPGGKPMALKGRFMPITNEERGPRSDQGGRRRHLVPLTTRLTLEAADSLRRAGLVNRLRGASPSTVQEIVELAVMEWLEREGFLEDE
jgi:hypothetical protein